MGIADTEIKDSVSAPLAQGPQGKPQVNTALVQSDGLGWPRNVEGGGVSALNPHQAQSQIVIPFLSAAPQIYIVKS